MDYFKQNAELSAQSTRVGVANAMSGKNKPMFKKKSDKINYVSKVEREKEIEEINKIFGV